MKRLKKRLNWEDLSKLTNEELYAIHAKIFKCDPYCMAEVPSTHKMKPKEKL